MPVLIRFSRAGGFFRLGFIHVCGASGIPIADVDLLRRVFRVLLFPFVDDDLPDERAEDLRRQFLDVCVLFTLPLWAFFCREEPLPCLTAQARQIAQTGRTVGLISVSSADTIPPAVITCPNMG